MKKYIVKLTPQQRQKLSEMIKSGKAAARELILLKADSGQDGPDWSDARIAEALDISMATVACVHICCTTASVQVAISPAKASRVRCRRLDGNQEAHLIELACSTPPEGTMRWTLRLLASTLAELGYVETISHETVRQVLLADERKPWMMQQWCIPTQVEAEFAYHIKDVLSVYTHPYNLTRPQVCMDEINTQLLSESRHSLEMKPGYPNAKTMSTCERVSAMFFGL
ncbi:hypothetical protein KDH_27880 [Dictyobacter sp. S3.2.2.5]|uniref:Transposase n=1 Tax=Dictyobacter halimunensis TaxID=3026934 RepID=A0ABQ6FNU8_9CHLR|nr:hypothetical protein KDH_27880 [Dictyobacter sp. S3.2.2.5]